VTELSVNVGAVTPGSIAALDVREPSAASGDDRASMIVLLVGAVSQLSRTLIFPTRGLS